MFFVADKKVLWNRDKLISLHEVIETYLDLKFKKLFIETKIEKDCSRASKFSLRFSELNSLQCSNHPSKYQKLLNLSIIYIQKARARLYWRRLSMMNKFCHWKQFISFQSQSLRKLSLNSNNPRFLLNVIELWLNMFYQNWQIL